MPRPTFLRRYLAGEHEEVWSELIQIGAAVRSPEHLPDAEAVARETMRRAASNIETLVARLNALDYRFEHPGWTFRRPPPDIAKQLADLEAHSGGPLPISLRAWCETVGSVCLDGSAEVVRQRPGLPPIRVHYGGEMMELRTASSLAIYEKSGEPLHIAPWLDEWRSVEDDDAEDDELRIAGVMVAVEGGALRRMKVPDASADARIGNIYFIEHLRQAFRWGGFPEYANAAWKPDEIIAHLRQDLLPI